MIILKFLNKIFSTTLKKCVCCSLSSHGGLDVLLRLSSLESGTDDGVGDILGGLADHHVVGHLETELVREGLELGDLVIGKGGTFFGVLLLDVHGGSRGNEEQDG